MRVAFHVDGNGQAGDMAGMAFHVNGHCRYTAAKPLSTNAQVVYPGQHFPFQTFGIGIGRFRA